MRGSRNRKAKSYDSHPSSECDCSCIDCVDADRALSPEDYEWNSVKKEYQKKNPEDEVDPWDYYFFSKQYWEDCDNGLWGPVLV